MLLCNLDIAKGFTVTQKYIGISANFLFALFYSKMHKRAIRYLTFIELQNSYMVGIKTWSEIFFARAPHPQEERINRKH